MCGRGGGGGGRRRRRGYGPNGFEEAGGYMAAKIAKLENQYKDSVTSEDGEVKKGLFSGVAIFVNGYTEPTAEELKRVMMVHGGIYHHYYSRTKTTHVITNNLPDVKIKNMNTERIVSPKWITDSLAAGHLLDHTQYILYSRQSKNQPQLPFKPALPSSKGPEAVKSVEGESKENKEKAGTWQDVKCVSPASDASGAHQSHTAASESFEDAEVTFEDEADSTKSPNTSTATNKSPVKGHAMSTANPKFLSEFYNNSRLHHISTMGAMFKEYVNELQNKCDGFPGREKLREWIAGRDGMTVGGSSSRPPSLHDKNKRIIMHVDMDCFFVSVGLRKHPELRDRPVAVTHGRGNNQAQVREGMDRQYEFNYHMQRAEKKFKAKIHGAGPARVTEGDPTEEQQDGSETSERRTEWQDKRLSTIDLFDDRSSMSEIASCNYEARRAGIRNGMYLGPALKLCPNLKMIPYDFEGYKEVSYKLYDIVASYTHHIEAVSCDEMFVDLTELLQACQVSPQDFTSHLRERVQAETGCPCSAGLGPNILVARMATQHAKPNGQHWADPKDLLLYMKDHKVTELPGVGWSTGRRLEAEGLATCGDLHRCSLAQLQTLLGPRTGHSLYNYSRGIDTRAVKSEHVRKSVSAEVNYGIRFTSQSDAHTFIGELAAEVEARLAAIKMKGKCITLKLKVRAKDAPVETAKFMGHGVCDNIAKSVSLAASTSSAAVIEKETLGLLSQVKTAPSDFRGVGIQVSRLEAASATHPPGSSIKSFLLSAKRKVSGSDTKAAGTLAAAASPAAGVTSAPGSRDRDVTVTGPVECHAGSRREHGAGHEASVSREPANASNDAPANDAKSIDVEVLLALPEDLRQQVMAEYQQQGYTIPALPGGTDSGTTSRSDPQPLPQPNTSGHEAPEERKTRASHHVKLLPYGGGGGGGEEASSSTAAAADGRSVSGASTSRQTSAGEPAGVRGPAGVQDLAENSNANSNFSTVSENAQDSPLITSFSQVDSSFLEAIPEELREELKRDLQHLKQAREGAAAAAAAPPQPRSHSPRGSPVKRGSVRGRGRGRPRGSGGKRGRKSKADSQRVEAEGLVTLTSMMLGSAGKAGNFKIKKNIPGAQKRDASPGPEAAPPAPGKTTAPAGGREGLPGVRGSPEPPQVLDEHVKEEEEKEEEEKKVEAEVLPDLCGLRELSDVKSLIRAWLASCAQPEGEDADILAGYLTCLITCHDLEKLDCLVKFLYRQIIRTKSKQWEAAYQEVIRQVQTVMLETHGAELKVPVFDGS